MGRKRDCGTLAQYEAKLESSEFERQYESHPSGQMFHTRLWQFGEISNCVVTRVKRQNLVPNLRIGEAPNLGRVQDDNNSKAPRSTRVQFDAEITAT